MKEADLTARSCVFLTLYVQYLDNDILDFGSSSLILLVNIND